MIVDVHTRLWETPEQLGSAMAQRLRDSAAGPWDRPDASVAAHDEAMQPVHYAFIHGAVSRHGGANITTEQVAGWVQRNPAKFLGVAGIDPLSGDSLSELTRARDLGMVAIAVSPTQQNFHPAHSQAMQLYEQCQEHSLPLFVDLSAQASTDVLEFAPPYLLDQIARAFPQLRMVIRGMGQPFLDQTLLLLAKHEHVYADITGMVQRPWALYHAMQSAHQMEVIGKLLFASGFPFTSPEKCILGLYSANTLAQGTHLPTIPREQLRGIVERDALSCLGLAYPPNGATPESTARGHSFPREHVPSGKEN